MTSFPTVFNWCGHVLYEPGHSWSTAVHDIINAYCKSLIYILFINAAMYTVTYSDYSILSSGMCTVVTDALRS